jgi:hypothetical protein
MKKRKIAKMPKALHQRIAVALFKATFVPGARRAIIDYYLDRAQIKEWKEVKR